MSKAKKSTVEVKGAVIAIVSLNKEDYISITDIAKYKEQADHVNRNWMRNRNTIEFLGIWERLNNPVYKPLEFDGFKNKAGLNSFVLTSRQWINDTLLSVDAGRNTCRSLSMNFLRSPFAMPNITNKWNSSDD
jgi:hypothetical protein